MTTFDEEWLVECFGRHDVEALIGDCGAPPDEYAPEAEVSLPLLLKVSNEEACLDALEQTWDRMFFPASHADRARLEPVAREVWKRLCDFRCEKLKAAKQSAS